MLGFCVPAPSLSGRSASLRVLPERAAGRFLKHSIWRILLVIRRPACGVKSIFLPGLREGRSKPAGLVDEVAQRLAGEETAAVVEDDLVAPVVEIGAVACGARRQQHPRKGPQLVVGGLRLLLEDVEAGAGGRRAHRHCRGGLGHASGLQMLCWRTFPRRSSSSST